MGSTRNRKSGTEKRDFKLSPASQFCSGLALSLWSDFIAAGGKSTENKNKTVFLGFCHFASLPSRQTLLTELTISSGWNDSQALSGSM